MDRRRAQQYFHRGCPLQPLDSALLLFVNTLEEARKLAPEAIRSAAENGLLWIAYPKGGSGMKTDVNRDRLWKALAGTGWRPVRQVALDDTWSAMRFRPEAQVKTRR